MIQFRQKQFGLTQKIKDLYFDKEADRIKNMRDVPDYTKMVRDIKFHTGRSRQGRIMQLRYSPILEPILHSNRKLEKKRIELEKRGVKNATFYEMTGKETMPDYNKKVANSLKGLS